jgi:lipopolysaccharide cholinephosphotransferase
MDKEELRKLQLYGLDILKEVDKFCKKNDIKYCLGEGTLLGAVRHNGFIPWDDDIDVLMTRENFDKFITTFKSKEYRVEYFNTLDKYWLPFAKVRMLKNTEFVTPMIEKISKYTGPRIDVLPLDYVPEKASKVQDKEDKKIKFWKAILRNKVVPLSKKKKIHYYIAWVIAMILPYKFIVNKLKKLTQKYDSSCVYVANKCGDYSMKKETFPKEYFDDLIDIKFEGQMLPIPRKYDKILTQIYGNYMKLPKVEERQVKHNVVVRK